MTRLAAASDAAPAEWVQRETSGFAQSVLSLVPAGFAAYVRVFHPAYRGGERVRWREVAAATGKRAHPAMQLSSFTGSDHLSDPLPGVFDGAPAVGTMPPEVARALADVLGRCTSTPASCWFAAWEGWGDLREDVAAAPAFALSGRRYHLLHGVVAAALGSVGAWSGQTASIWWPDDRAWCVATEVDLNSTYIGCSEHCRDELLAEAELEASALPPSTGITIASDVVNGLPALPSL